jgi:hypothetical protein
LAAAFAVAGQTPQKNAPPRKPAASAGQKAPLTDAELERAIQERFSRSKIAADNFQVRVRAGVATLEGRTDVIQHKGTATRLAKNAGARHVQNKIEVSEQARQKASANLAEGRRRVQVKRSEAKHR